MAEDIVDRGVAAQQPAVLAGAGDLFQKRDVRAGGVVLRAVADADAGCLGHRAAVRLWVGDAHQVRAHVRRVEAAFIAPRRHLLQFEALAARARFGPFAAVAGLGPFDKTPEIEPVERLAVIAERFHLHAAVPADDPGGDFQVALRPLARGPANSLRPKFAELLPVHPMLAPVAGRVGRECHAASQAILPVGQERAALAPVDGLQRLFRARLELGDHEGQKRRELTRGKTFDRLGHGFQDRRERLVGDQTAANHGGFLDEDLRELARILGVVITSACGLGDNLQRLDLLGAVRRDADGRYGDATGAKLLQELLGRHAGVAVGNNDAVLERGVGVFQGRVGHLHGAAEIRHVAGGGAVDPRVQLPALGGGRQGKEPAISTSVHQDADQILTAQHANGGLGDFFRPIVAPSELGCVQDKNQGAVGHDLAHFDFHVHRQGALDGRAAVAAGAEAVFAADHHQAQPRVHHCGLE